MWRSRLNLLAKQEEHSAHIKMSASLATECNEVKEYETYEDLVLL